MIKLRSITAEDVAKIKTWPAYEDGFEQMDYALRDKGWIDEFRNNPDTLIYGAEEEGRIIGFSLLAMSAPGEAEFRIAIHPLLTGKGLGRQITLATLQEGFRHHMLNKVHLIVRKNNPRAAKLYESVGFKKTAESIHVIQGKPVEFEDMDMAKEEFNERVKN